MQLPISYSLTSFWGGTVAGWRPVGMKVSGRSLSWWVFSSTVEVAEFQGCPSGLVLVSGFWWMQTLVLPRCPTLPAYIGPSSHFCFVGISVTLMDLHSFEAGCDPFKPMLTLCAMNFPAAWDSSVILTIDYQLFSISHFRIAWWLHLYSGSLNEDSSALMHTRFSFFFFFLRIWERVLRQDSTKKYYGI